ncbi:MAG: hypothetical protein ACK5GN_10100 [Pseudomonadota bacterium]|jgi:hypothetical protein
MLRLHLTTVVCMAALYTACAEVAAEEIRVVDSRGLVRAVQVVSGAARMVIRLEPKEAGAARGECVATNVDGLAAERRVPVAHSSECIFTDMVAGSWQITVPKDHMWRVQISPSK